MYLEFRIAAQRKTIPVHPAARTKTKAAVFLNLELLAVRY